MPAKKPIRWETVRNIHCEFCEKLFDKILPYEKLPVLQRVRCPHCGKHPRLSED